MKDAYCIPISTGEPKIYLYSSENIQDDLKENGLKKFSQLDDYDFKVFDTEKKARAWLKRYLKILRALSNKKICKSRDLPAILYKRRYMVQTLMGEKSQTYRSYKKDWKPGQLFNLHDQVFFLTVRLKRIVKTTDGYKYEFDRKF